MSAHSLKAVISSGRLLNFESLVFCLKPLPVGAYSSFVTFCAKFAAHASKWVRPLSRR